MCIKLCFMKYPERDIPQCILTWRGCLYEIQDGTKKRDGMTKERRKSLSFLYRTIIGTCYCKWNRGVWNPSRQMRQGLIFLIYPFCKQPVYKQTVLACEIANVKFLSNFHGSSAIKNNNWKLKRMLCWKKCINQFGKINYSVSNCAVAF